MANYKAGAKGAASGAAAGAALGPWGALAGGAIGGGMGLFSDDGSAEKEAAARAEAAKIAQEKRNAIALSDYRLNSKNQYDTLKNNTYAPYAGYSQRLQAAYGQGMSGPQGSAVSLADTGIGAPDGSKAAGWDSWEDNPGNKQGIKKLVHHTGYNEYLNGTATMPGQAYQIPGTQGHESESGRRVIGTATDANAGGIPQTVGQTFMPGSNQIAPTTPGVSAPGTQYKFFPGGR